MAAQRKNINKDNLMTLPILYGDEAGNTGPFLLDADQPTFAYAVTDLQPGEAAEALACLELNSAEVHSTSLFRRKGGMDRLVRFFQYPAVSPDRMSVFLIHKKHMVVTKMIDLLVENLAHRDGVDLYQDGANIALGNYASMMIESFLSTAQQAQLLGSFVEMFKHQTQETVDAFYEIVGDTMRGLPSKQEELFATFMAPIFMSHTIISDVFRGNDKFTLDPIVPSLFSLAYHWSKKYPGGFVMKADEAKTLALKRDEIALFMAQHLEGITVGYDRRKHPARLPIRELIFCKSHIEPSIQVADIVAGVVTRYVAPFAGLLSGKKRSDELAQFNPESFLIGSVWPSRDMTPQTLGTNHEGGLHPVNVYPNLLKPAG